MKKDNKKKEIAVSTLRMISENKPAFPLGKVCGKYWTYPKESKDVEGGLRLSGKCKQDTEQFPLISYVTVVYNRRSTLNACMASIWMQTYPNIEYIVVDGASKDGTLELLVENQDKIDYFISQKDNGIYDAMNKGISLASGRYVCFMNSDDVCVPMAAEHVVEEAKRTGADIICGSRELWQDGKKQEEITYLRVPIKNCVFRYLQMYHQATYASRNAFEIAGYFDLQYKLLADWIWESKCIDKGLKVDFFEDVLTRFHYDGASYLGMEIRDEDWIRWIQNTFPEISRKDAETFLFALDQYRAPYFEVSTLMPLIRRYRRNDQLMKSLYETILLCSIHSAYDLILIKKIYGKSAQYEFCKNENLMEPYSKCQNLLDLIDEMVLQLKRSCENESGSVSMQDMSGLSVIRRLENNMFERELCRIHIGKEKCSWFLRMKYIPYFTIDRIAARSTFFSRELFRLKRTRMIRRVTKKSD